MTKLILGATKGYQYKILFLCIVFLLSFADFTVAQHALDVDARTNDESPSIQIDIKNALVALDVRDASLVDILQEIAQKTELIVYIHDSLDERITLQVENLSLPEVLAKLLRNHSFALRYVKPISNRGSVQPEAVSKLWVYADVDTTISTEKSVSNLGSPVRVIRSEKNKEQLQPEKEDATLAQHDSGEQISDLSVMLLDENKNVRLDAVATLADMGNAGSLTLLASALNDEDSAVREQAVDALLALDRVDTVHLFEQAINDTDSAVRAAAISAISEIGDSESVRILGTALHNQYPQAREEIIYALGDLDGESATKLIELGLKDPHRSVRLAAVETLASTDRTESIVALATALNDESSLVREEIIYALAELGGDDAIDLLKQATTDKDKTIASLASETLDSLSNE